MFNTTNSPDSSQKKLRRRKTDHMAATRNVQASSAVDDPQIREILERLGMAMAQIQTMVQFYHGDKDTVNKLQELERNLAVISASVVGMERLVTDSSRQDSMISRLMRLEAGLETIRQHCAGCTAAGELEDLTDTLEELRALFDAHTRDGLADTRYLQGLQTAQRDRQQLIRKIIAGVAIALIVGVMVWLVPVAIKALLITGGKTP